MRRRLRALLACGVLLAGCSTPATVAEGHPAPAFAAADLDGRVLALAELRGEVVLINVWATWCRPCRREMPALDRLSRELAAQGLRVVAVSVYRVGDDRGVRRRAWSRLHHPARRGGPGRADVPHNGRSGDVPDRP